MKDNLTDSRDPLNRLAVESGGLELAEKSRGFRQEIVDKEGEQIRMMPQLFCPLLVLDLPANQSFNQ